VYTTVIFSFNKIAERNICLSVFREIFKFHVGLLEWLGMHRGKPTTN